MWDAEKDEAKHKKNTYGRNFIAKGTQNTVTSKSFWQKQKNAKKNAKKEHQKNAKKNTKKNAKIKQKKRTQKKNAKEERKKNAKRTQNTVALQPTFDTNLAA